jgi:hypothetical protein
MDSFASPADLTAPAEARAERRLRLLAELAELGMTLARTLVAQAEDGAEAASQLAYARIARAVRQTLALEAKLADESQVRREKQAREYSYQRQAKVRRLVERAIEADADDSDTDTLLDDLNERLADPDDTDFTNRPLIDVVAAICKDLGVTFDPSPWQDEPETAADPDPPPQPLTAQPTLPTPRHPGFREAKDRDP